MRALLFTVGLGLLAASCGGGAREPAPATSLEITVWPEGRGPDALSTTFTLTCEPAGGTHSSPEAACAALAANERALEPPGPDEACTQIYGGPETALVSGTYRGRRIHAAFDRTDGCQIARWDALAPVLGQPGSA